MMASAVPQRLPAQPLSPGLLSVVLAVHAGLLLAIASAQQFQLPVLAPRALTVSLIEIAEEVKNPEPKPQPTRPVVKPQPMPQVLAVAQPENVAAEQVPVLEPPRPVVEPETIAPAVVAEAPKPTPPPPIIQPRFDANYLDNPKPPYPGLSKRLREEGVVQLRVFVNADGSVGRIELKRTSGHPRLDQSAMSTVQNWRFMPARQGSDPVAAWVVVPIHFTFGS